MKNLWPLVFVALVSLCVGAVLDEGLHVIRGSRSKVSNAKSTDVFQRRVRCKILADEYAKKSSDNNTTLFSRTG